METEMAAETSISLNLSSSFLTTFAHRPLILSYTSKHDIRQTEPLTSKSGK